MASRKVRMLVWAAVVLCASAAASSARQETDEYGQSVVLTSADTSDDLGLGRHDDPLSVGASVQHSKVVEVPLYAAAGGHHHSHHGHHHKGFHDKHGHKGHKGHHAKHGHKKHHKGHYGKGHKKGFFDKGAKHYGGHHHNKHYKGHFKHGKKGKKGHKKGSKGHLHKGHKKKVGLPQPVPQEGVRPQQEIPRRLQQEKILQRPQELRQALQETSRRPSQRRTLQGRQAPQQVRQARPPQEGPPPPPRQGPQEALRSQGPPRSSQTLRPQTRPSRSSLRSPLTVNANAGVLVQVFIKPNFIFTEAFLVLRSDHTSILILK